ncbi:HD domain-containing protein [Chloroflexota bacterium]
MTPANLQPQTSPRPLHWDPFVTTLQEVLGEDTRHVYLVGGVVRDAFWGTPVKDFDLAVSDHAFAIARKIANKLDGAFYKLDSERGTGRTILEHEGRPIIVDVATFRGPVFGSENDPDLLADLQGRDFTLNAVAAPLAGELTTVIDPMQGLADMQQRILRRCSPAAISSDPIRAIRAVRMCVRFKLRMEPATLADVRAYGPALTQTSPERVRDEFMALLSGRNPAAALRTLDALDLLELIMPEVGPLRDVAQSPPHQYDVWTHTLRTVEQLTGILQTISPQRSDNTAAQASLGMIVYYLDKYRAQLQEHLTQVWPNDRPHTGLLMLAALLHDSGKPATRSENEGRIQFITHEHESTTLAEERAAMLRLSNQESKRLQAIIRHHMRPHQLAAQGISRRAVYRFWRACGPAGIDVCLHALADYLATNGAALSPDKWGDYLLTIDTLLAGYLGDEQVNVTQLPKLVTGKDLMKVFTLESGPHIGELLELIHEAQAANEIHTREEALDLARQNL